MRHCGARPAALPAFFFFFLLINQKREEQDLSQSTAKVDSAGGRRVQGGGPPFLQPTTDLQPPVAAPDDVLNHTLLVLFGRQLSGRNDVYGKRRIAVGRNSKRDSWSNDRVLGGRGKSVLPGGGRSFNAEHNGGDLEGLGRENETDENKERKHDYNGCCTDGRGDGLATDVAVLDDAGNHVIDDADVTESCVGKR